jgi:putative phage-type endonuclease
LHPIPLATSQTPEWYAKRKLGVGASESASLLGLPGAYQTPLDLYLSKTTETATVENRAMRRGTLLEPLLIAEFQEQSGLKVKAHPCPLYQHPEHTFLLATPDGELENGDLLELKTLHPRFASQLGEPGTDQAPLNWVCQAQQQMAVTGAKRVHLFCMTGFEDSWHGVVERNDRLIDLIIARTREFWAMVEARTPPPPDWSRASDLEAIARLYPVDVGKVLRMPDRMAAAWMQRQRLEQRAKRLAARADKLKAKVLHAMGDAEIAFHPDVQWEIVRSKRDEVVVEKHTKKAHVVMTQRKRRNEYGTNIEGTGPDQQDSVAHQRRLDPPATGDVASETPDA